MLTKTPGLVRFLWYSKVYCAPFYYQSCYVCRQSHPHPLLPKKGGTAERGGVIPPSNGKLTHTPSPFGATPFPRKGMPSDNSKILISPLFSLLFHPFCLFVVVRNSFLFCSPSFQEGGDRGTRWGNFTHTPRRSRRTPFPRKGELYSSTTTRNHAFSPNSSTAIT